MKRCVHFDMQFFSEEAVAACGNAGARHIFCGRKSSFYKSNTTFKWNSQLQFF